MKKFKQFSITVYDQFVLFETRSFFSNLLHNNDCEGYHFWSQTYQWLMKWQVREKSLSFIWKNLLI